MPTFKQLIKLSQETINDKTSGKRAKEIFEIMKKDQVLHGMNPEKAVRFLEDLGPTYVKIGQIASNRADILPKEYCEAFAELRSNVDPLDFDVVLSCIEQVYGDSWKTVFAKIDSEPLGSASIAQVHKAVLHDGTEVAVKVRRPGIKEEMAEDIALLRHMLTLAEVSTSEHHDLVMSFEGLLDELERTTENELDFTIELHNLVRFRQELEGCEGVTCPQAYPEYSSESILVMEYVTGPEINDHEALLAAGDNLDELANRLAQNYIHQVIDEGFFHADPHEGNIIVRDHEIVWIDLGMTGSLNSSQRMLVNKAFIAVASKDPYQLKDAMLGLTTSRGPVNQGLLLQQMEQMLNSYGSADLADINIGEVMMEIVEILRSQNLSINTSFTMLARGFITIEGVVSVLSPSASVIKIVREHVEKQLFTLSSALQKAKEIGMQTAHSFDASTKLPTQLSHTLDMLNEGEISLGAEMNMPKDLKSTVYSLTGYLAFALISAGLFIGSSIICTTDMMPRFLGVPLLGIVGYLSAFVLGVYVVWQMIYARHKTRNDEDIK